MQKEIRNIGDVKASIEDRKIEGYALVFDTPSNDLGGFVEVIERDAIDEEIINKSDILALLDHSISRGILARSKNGEGTLKLDVDEKGLWYSFEAPKTQLGDELIEYLKRGDVTQSSFAFTIEDEDWEVKGDTYLRRIKKFKQLYDVSAVYSPAYNETSVDLAMRSLENFKAQKDKEDLTEYFNNLKSKIKK